MQCYVDATFLAAAVSRWPESDAAIAFIQLNGHELVTSPVTRVMLRTLIAGESPHVRGAAMDLLDRIGELRFSDKGLEHSSMVATTMDPFVALQIGAILGTPDVGRAATYDPQLALACALFKIEVLSPGRAEGWYL